MIWDKRKNQSMCFDRCGAKKFPNRHLPLYQMFLVIKWKHVKAVMKAFCEVGRTGKSAIEGGLKNASIGLKKIQ